jgi:uncharacterized DUF497 family protein
LLKHGVSFEEAVTVFSDDYAMQYFDAQPFEDELRYIMLGMSYRLRVLVVCHCERNDGKTIRIISARKATSKECSYYRGPMP